jgi:ribose 5-phosphate isomerase B
MIAIGSDHAGFQLKSLVADILRAAGIAVEDLGTDDVSSVDYPDFAHRVAAAVAGGTAERGVLICGTGIGMSMAANRHPGVRAALCHDAYTAEMARRHNDANVLCLGARVVGEGVAEQVLRIFLETPFEGGRHQRRVDSIERLQEVS